MKTVQLTVFFVVNMSISCVVSEDMRTSREKKPVQENVENVRSSLARDMDEMKNAGFTFVYVLRRKDGQKLDAEDRGVIRLQTVDMNRRVLSDEDKAVIIGSNFQIPPQNLGVLFASFAVENFSQPTPEANVNSNANK